MKNIKIIDRTFLFSLKSIELYKILQSEGEYIISKQLLRSTTSIGANVHEASAAISKRDFAHKMSIASKEARESDYWIQLLDKGKLTKCDLEFYKEEIANIVNILSAIVKTTQKNLRSKN